MSGYSYHPLFRLTPRNGSAEYYDLRVLFADTSGPSRIRLRHQIDQDRKQDINRRMRVFTYGYRMDLGLTFELFDMTDQATLAQILNRMIQPEYSSEISLNAGATYYGINYTGHTGPEPLGGKTYAGARYEVSLVSTDLLPEIPGVASALGTPNVVSATVGLPIPAAAYKWQIWVVTGGGVADIAWQSLANGAGVFGWVPIAAGA